MIVFSCQKNEEIDTQSSKNVIAKKISFNDIKENSELRQTLKTLEKHLDYIKKKSVSKGNSSNDSFSILTNEILQVNTATTVAYYL